jgi:hypothetical protein
MPHQITTSANLNGMLLRNYDHVKHNTFSCFLLNVVSLLQASNYDSSNLLEFLDQPDCSFVLVLIVRLFTSILIELPPFPNSRMLSPHYVNSAISLILASSRITLLVYLIYEFVKSYIFLVPHTETLLHHSPNSIYDLQLSDLKHMFHTYLTSPLLGLNLDHIMNKIPPSRPTGNDVFDTLYSIYTDIVNIPNSLNNLVSNFRMLPYHNDQLPYDTPQLQFVPSSNPQKFENYSPKAKEYTSAFLTAKDSYLPDPVRFNGPHPLLTVFSSVPVSLFQQVPNLYDLSINFTIDIQTGTQINLPIDPYCIDDSETDLCILQLLFSWFTTSTITISSTSDFARALYIQLMLLIHALEKSDILSEYKNLCERICRLANLAKTHHHIDTTNPFSSLLKVENVPFFRTLFLDDTSDLYKLILGLALPTLSHRRLRQYTSSSEATPLPYIQSLITWILIHAIPSNLGAPCRQALNMLRTPFIHNLPSWTALQTCILRSYAHGFPLELATNDTDPDWLNFCSQSTLPFIVQHTLLLRGTPNTFPKSGFKIVRHPSPDSTSSFILNYVEKIKQSQLPSYDNVSFELIKWLIDVSNRQSLDYNLTITATPYD